MLLLVFGNLTNIYILALNLENNVVAKKNFNKYNPIILLAIASIFDTIKYHYTNFEKCR